MAKATKGKKARPAEKGPASRKRGGSSGPKSKASSSKKAKVEKKAKASGAEAQAPATPPGQSAPAPVDAAANAALAGRAALAGTQAAGKAVSLAAARVRVPLAAGSGLAAGVVGGLAVIRRRQRPRRGSGFDIASAAERVGALGEEVGKVAIVIQKAADGSKRSK